MNWQATTALMLAGHLVADYTLQGWLADGKRKSWWFKICDGNLPDEYRYDYVAALVCHSLYWSIFVCSVFYDSRLFLAAIAVNTLVHAVVDDLKVNRMKINLIADQLLHLSQILITFAVLN